MPYMGKFNPNVYFLVTEVQKTAYFNRKIASK